MHPQPSGLDQAPVVSEAARAAMLADKLSAARLTEAYLQASQPHWLWLTECGDHGPEERLYRSYPQQGLAPVRQCDVTVFARGAA